MCVDYRLHMIIYYPGGDTIWKYIYVTGSAKFILLWLRPQLNQYTPAARYIEIVWINYSIVCPPP